MELNIAYNDAHTNNRRERETQVTTLENTAYNNDEISQGEQYYSVVENDGRETFTSKSNTAYAINREVFTTESNSTSNVLNNTNSGTRQGLAKNECAKKWLAIFVVVALFCLC